MNVKRIDPPCWFSGVKTGELQILIYGDDVKGASVKTTIPNEGMIVSTETEDSYLLLSLKLKDKIQANTYEIVLNKSDDTIKIPYEFKERRNWDACKATITNEDVVYLLMPDRFAKVGEEDGGSIDTDNSNVWHGGNIKGMIKSLEHLDALGVTAIWHTPIFMNSEYHGYSITDFYHIDSRFGSLEDYKEFVREAHKRNIKVVMDMVFNHCSIEHPWVKQPPMSNWLNGTEKNHIQTNYKITTIFDPYKSSCDKNATVRGWFTDKMPDINIENQSVYTYLKQMTMWWIEMTGIDAFRMDTYLYSDMDKMIEWQNEISKIYPGLSVIAETWVPEVAYTAKIQNEAYGKLNENCSLIVMDFAFQKKLEQTFDRTVLYDKDAQMYHHFVYDFLYKDAPNTLVFIDNHDLERWFSRIKSKAKLKQALAILLTSPRIPQIYYGTEWMFSGDGKGKGDGNYRMDAFDALNDWEKWQKDEVWSYLRNLLHWRKTSKAVTKGSMKHFIPQNGVYVYFRSAGDEVVMVVSNNTSKSARIDLLHYAEVLDNWILGVDVASGLEVQLDVDYINIKGHQTLILELKRNLI